MLVERRYAQKSTIPATFATAISYVGGVIPLGLFAGLILFPHHINWSGQVVMLMVLLGSAMAIANWLGFIVAKKLNVAALLVMRRVTSVMVIVLGWTILGETLTASQFIGGTILLLAATLAIFAPVKNTEGEYAHMPGLYIFLALVGALFAAIGLVTEKALLGHMEVGGVFLTSWVAQAIAMTLFATKDLSRKNIRSLKRHEIKWSMLMGLANGISGVFYVYAISQSDNISLVTTVGAIGLPLTVLGAYIFLGEREHHFLMWLSIAISFAGLLVMAL